MYISISINVDGYFWTLITFDVYTSLIRLDTNKFNIW